MKKVFRDVRCLIRSGPLVFAVCLLYSVAIIVGYFTDRFAFLIGLAVVHVFVGISAIRISRRSFIFGLWNLIAELAFLIAIGWTVNLFLAMLVSENPRLIRDLGVTPWLHGKTGYISLGAAFDFCLYGLPGYFVTWVSCYALSSTFPDEERFP